jgi:hypothetical protein
MKCDRRWWNDGRLEREKAACVACGDWRVSPAPFRADPWVELVNSEITAKMEECWRKLMEGDPNGLPWPEVLAAWAPEPEPNARSFFGVPRLRDTIICGNEELFMRALERAGLQRSKEPAQAHGGVPILEDKWMPRNKAVFIDAHGKFTWVQATRLIESLTRIVEAGR